MARGTVAIDNIRFSGIQIEDEGAPILVCPGNTISDVTASVCHPIFYTGCPTDYIDQMKIYTIAGDTLMNTGLTGCVGTQNAYFEYPPEAGITSCTLQTGSQYSVYLKTGPAFPMHFGVWIDYNNDGDFDDTGEFIRRNLQASIYFCFSFTVSVVPLGIYRMRVIANYSAIMQANQSCIIASWGEASDFLITIEIPTIGSTCNVIPDYSGWGGVYDLYDHDVTIAQEPAAGTTITEDMEVTLTATDDTGNSSQCTFVIPYLEPESPVLNCPQNITILVSPVAMEGYVEVPLPDVSPTCSPVGITNNMNDNTSASGIFPAGISSVNYVATSGEFSSTCTVQIELIPTCCTGDFDCDGSIAVSDLILLMNDFGCLNVCSTDLNNDGLVNVYDVQGFMSLLQPTCP